MSPNHHDDPHPDDHQDGGFALDLPRLIGRRNLLALMGAAGAGALAAGPAAAMGCVALPWETAGPYPGDGTNSNRAGQVVNVLTQAGVVRDDIRPSFADYTGTADGAGLVFELTLLDAKACTPLAGHAVYLWHCNAAGEYSLYDVADQNYLRGVAVTDAEGKLRLTSIVPGCYAGRWPHIHFEVFTDLAAAVSGQASVLTAQIALPHDVVAPLYDADPRYAGSSENLSRLSIARDNVFGDNTQAEITQQTLAMSGDAAQGYAGSVTIPVDFTADRNVSMQPPPPGGPGGPPPGGPGGPPPGPPPSN